jgi:hypothetical protein
MSRGALDVWAATQLTTRVRPAVAAVILGVKPRTLHKWAREGRVTRHPDGFDLAELLEAEASRDFRALLIRAGIKKEHWPDDTPDAREG